MRVLMEKTIPAPLYLVSVAKAVKTLDTIANELDLMAAKLREAGAVQQVRARVSFGGDGYASICVDGDA
jgi:hypothetical protein